MSGSMIVGGLFVAGGFWMVRRAFRSRARRVALIRDCVRVSGKVIRIEDTTTDGDVVSTVAPVVCYKAKDGQTYETTLLPRQVTKACRIGTSVPLFYERGKPSHAVHALRMWDVNIVCAVCLVPVLIGAGALYTAYQESAEPKNSPSTQTPASP